MVRQEGKREVKREIEHYNLDVIISVGYRVKSKQGTQFRIWANSVLKSYLVQGYGQGDYQPDQWQKRMNMPAGYAVACRWGSVKQAGMIADGLAVSELRLFG